MLLVSLAISTQMLSDILLGKYWRGWGDINPYVWQHDILVMFWWHDAPHYAQLSLCMDVQLLIAQIQSQLSYGQFSSCAESMFRAIWCFTYVNPTYQFRTRVVLFLPFDVVHVVDYLVTRREFDSNNFAGSLPTELGALASLTEMCALGWIQRV